MWPLEGTKKLPGNIKVKRHMPLVDTTVKNLVVVQATVSLWQTKVKAAPLLVRTHPRSHRPFVISPL
jgi:hypothetical protein